LLETVPAPGVTGGSDARIRVGRIVLQGVVDRPALGISVSELAALVEQLRRQLSESPPPAGQGVAELVEKTEKRTQDAKTKDARVLAEVIRRFREISSPPKSLPAAGTLTDTLSLRQLQEIAARVARYYRERGLFLAQALIPPQTIDNETVQIRVLEGILGNVTLDKNRRYDDTRLLLPFRGLLGQPVTRARIEEAMLLLNDYPGLKSFAMFRPGIRPGETNLLLSVLEEKRVDTVLHTDNYGSEFTGEYRARIDVNVNNPLGAADRLSASLSKTYAPRNGTYGALFYERQAFGPRNTFGVGASRNAYSLGGVLEPFGINGTTTLAQIYWRRAFQRSRLSNRYGLLQFARKSAKLDVSEGEDREDQLSVIEAEIGFDWSSVTRRHIASGALRLSHGFSGLLGSMETTDDPAQTRATRRGGSGFYAGGEFDKLNADYHHWLNLNRDQMLHFSLRGQYSDDLLTSLEQMPIGGPNSVRAYASAEFLRDKAVVASLEWIVRAPGFADWPAFAGKRWGDIVQAVLFVDYANGWLNDPLASDREEVSLDGVGAGLRARYGGFSARFEFAKAVGDEPVSNDRDPQYYFELNYGF
jgi:hemolysin activation/secretion protein